MNTIQSVIGRASAFSVRTLCLMLGCLAFAWPLVSQQPAAALHPGGDPNKLYLQGERSLSVSYLGEPTAVQALSAGQLKPLALATGDLDGDGIEDLVAGYASANGGVLVIHRGNLDAFAPQSEGSWQAIGEGRFPSPFLPEASAIALPEAPDFLATGNFTGAGRLDVVVGARGSHTLYILAGDGNGGLLRPQAIALSGALTALGATHFDSSTTYSHVVAAITAQTGSQLIIFEGTVGGINAVANAALKSPATSLAFGKLSGDAFDDAAVVAGGGLFVVHGRDVRAARVGEGPANLQVEPISLPFSASNVTVGSFIQDRASRLQMGVLGTDGSVHIVTRARLDTRPWSLAELQTRRRARMNRQPDPLAIPVDPAEGWQVAESFPAVVSVANPNAPPILLRTRISSRGSDDVMILDSNLAQMHVIGHESMLASATAIGSLPPSFHSTLTMGASGGTAAGIPMRVNIDGRPGVVVLKQGESAPQVMMPLPDPTFFPNRFDDPTPTSPITNACNNVNNADISSSCSLREAVIKANSIAGTDTIMLAAGTYTLSIPRNAADHSSSTSGTLEVQDSLNIIGAVDGGGNPASIVQGGTNLATSVDKVFSFNQDIDSFTNATVSISNLVITNGFNRGNATILDGWGGAFDFDTGGTGNNTLTVTNCNITTNKLTEGEGGGIAIFNTNNGTGVATITNSTIQNNTVAPSSPSGIAGTGGGIFMGTPAAIVLNNTKVLNNSATANAGGVPIGGGMNFVGPSGLAGQSAIHGSTISGNSASQTGGGISSTANLLIDTGTVISGNTSGTQGGGIYHNALTPDTLTISKITITGNTATASGGGIASGNGTGGVTLSMQFSRLAGNTATAGNGNLENINSVITATNNWWGTNSPAGTITTSAGTTTFDPFIVLTHTANPQKIRINQSTTLTGDMSKDNHGNGAALSGNLNEIV
ncbi:MAG TPA: right-handed parallel beta-helix repeat-containing protein, partial [Verrucomicrobiae bacterium]|nr:right-handed parallel beta-helix repeat-containing protein [Verrucomicrobiae bacterium]